MTAPPALFLAGAGAALPGRPVTNDHLASVLGISEEWIDLFVGTRARHFAWDLATGDLTHTLADLCAEAAGQALHTAGLTAREVDFVVLATATPDRLLPATVNEVTDQLGIDQLPTYQLQTGCAGAVAALDLSRWLLAGGGHHTGLVIAGDVTARFIDTRREALRLPTEELVNYVLFGDGAGACVVSAQPVGHAVAVTHLVHCVTGRDRPPGQIVNWRGPVRREATTMLYEDYKAIEEHVPAMATQILWELADSAGWAPDQVQFLLPPQLSGRMTRRITDQLAVPGPTEISCVADTGNAGNAMTLLQLDKLLPQLPPGGRALAVAVESSKWIKAGLALQRTDHEAP